MSETRVAQTRQSWTLYRSVLHLLDRRRERLGMVLIGITASIASFSEALILVIISLAALRLAQGSAQPVDLPFGLPADELSTPLLLVLGLLALFTRLASLLINSATSARLVAGVQQRWRERVVTAYQQASWEVQVGQEEGFLQMLAQTYVNRLGGVLQNATVAITSGIGFLSFVAGSFLIDPLIAVALTLVGAVLSVLFRPMASTVRRLSTTISESGREYNRLVSEAATLALEHRTLGASESVATQLRDELDVQARASRRQMAIQTIAPHLYTAVGYLGIIGGLAVASRMQTDQIALLGAIVLMMIRSLAYGQAFIGTSQTAASAEPYVAELLRSLGHLESGRHEYGSHDGGDAEVLELANVSLGYRDRAVVDSANLRIQRGESIGLIGPSGGGKSTLAMAIMGLIPPMEGVYLIDGIDSREYSANWWSSHFSIVPQKPELFDGTIAENIRLHRSMLTEADVSRAAEQAHLNRDLSTWSAELAHHVGPRGSRLSGGQRQRVCIARALVGRPRVLVLDEPTSSLDTTAEDAITDVLQALHGTCTLVVVAHRISTLAFCDRVLLVQDGRLVEVGSGRDVQERDDLRDLCAKAMSEQEFAS